MVYLDSISRGLKGNTFQKPPKPKRKISKILIFVFSILIIVMGVIYFLNYEIKRPQYLAAKVSFKIEKGESVDAISRNLKNTGLIKSIILFKFYLVINNKAANIRAGLYSFSDSVTIVQIIESITKGTQNQTTIWEGMRIEEIAQFLDEKELVKATDFISEARVGKFKNDYAFLSGLSSQNSLEGFLFPDTYEFEVKTSADNIIKKMLDNFQEKVYQEIESDLKEQNKKIEDVLILSSIVEREVSDQSQKSTVAGIYLNRLSKNMRLEADPTVQYAKDTEIPPVNYQNFWKEILTSDYRSTISPYNTYIGNGLPPGPICNPGLDSILAAINSKSSDYLYFFTPDGEIFYSKTGEEHEAKKKQYLK